MKINNFKQKDHQKEKKIALRGVLCVLKPNLCIAGCLKSQFQATSNTGEYVVLLENNIFSNYRFL